MSAEFILGTFLISLENFVFFWYTTKRGDTMKLSIVVPCFNEEGNVKKLFEEIKQNFKDIMYEIIFVNDGSRDATQDELKKLYEENKSYTQVITFSRNFGKEAALYAGLKASAGDLVLLIDADLQQSPAVAVSMMEILDKNPDIDCVAAYQQVRNEGKIISFFKSCFYKLINKISDVEFVNGASDFRLMRRNMVDAILSMTEYHRFSKGIFGWVGFNTEYIPYEATKRASGKSKWKFKNLVKYAMEGITSFSTSPLRFSAYIGFITSLVSIIYMIVTLVQKLAFGIDVPGYATLAVLVLFFGGLQLFCLGVLGEYFAKMYIEVKNRPVYIIKEHLKDE